MRMWKQVSKKQRRRARGMTLVEIMVVITIIGLITAAVAVAVMPKLVEARQERARSDIKAIENAADLYKMKKGQYPKSLDDLVKTQNLKETPIDPWGNPYIYVLDGNAPLIKSKGGDGKEGGEGEDMDISNRDKATTAQQ
ncbi:MAG: type II secretion system protein GspG [Myxococcaceae bacterium]|nr:type II secretion system protein GspG [Myxococcaceae bacterium]